MNIDEELAPARNLGAGEGASGNTLLQTLPWLFGGALFAALMFFAPVILTGGWESNDEPAPVLEESTEPLPAELPERFQPNDQPVEQPSDSWLE